MWSHEPTNAAPVRLVPKVGTCSATTPCHMPLKQQLKAFCMYAHLLCSRPICCLTPHTLQDLYNLSTALTANLHELLEAVKGLANKVLGPSAAAANAASQQWLSELAGGFVDALGCLCWILPGVSIFRPALYVELGWWVQQCVCSCWQLYYDA